MPAIIPYYPVNTVFLVNTHSVAMKDKRKLPPPPKNSIMFSSRYKTEICRQFEELGQCEYGERCLFAHGSYELRDLPNRHPKHKTQECNAYAEQGFCTFGPRCSFIHKKPDIESIIDEMQQKSKSEPMPENPSRFVHNGDGDCYVLTDDEVDRAVHQVDTQSVIFAFKNDGNKRLPIFLKLHHG
ncbi:hypothetical protein B4U80_10329 [Leptotrombidium deliense]|uniref:C3H1-type domain-containing protein n=1 Tax=Leptotrombidium deliense TaxID=299467 RepID=A0A443SJR3_9ACAR|nr:hypothetical protein B4U80_10329 [Leptotrombidium deliense]